MQPSLLFSISLISLLVRVALKLRSLRFHSPRVCRIAVFSIQTIVSLCTHLSAQAIPRWALFQHRYHSPLSPVCLFVPSACNENPPFPLDKNQRFSFTSRRAVQTHGLAHSSSSFFACSFEVTLLVRVALLGRLPVGLGSSKKMPCHANQPPPLPKAMFSHGQIQVDSEMITKDRLNLNFNSNLQCACVRARMGYVLFRM